MRGDAQILAEMYSGILLERRKSDRELDYPDPDPDSLERIRRDLDAAEVASLDPDDVDYGQRSVPASELEPDPEEILVPGEKTPEEEEREAAEERQNTQHQALSAESLRTWGGVGMRAAREIVRLGDQTPRRGDKLRGIVLVANLLANAVGASGDLGRRLRAIEDLNGQEVAERFLELGEELESHLAEMEGVPA